MLDGVSLDPYVVLGVARDATAEQIRDAYRRQSKRYHPDAGGDEWAFRIVVRAYESLSAEPRPGPAADRAHADPAAGRIRPGVHDKDVDATRLVAVELLWQRYEFGDVLDLLVPRPADARPLAGTLIIRWPDEPHAARPLAIPGHDRVLRAVHTTFIEARGRPEVDESQADAADGRFVGVLRYRTGHAASLAFKHLHVRLKARGLGVRQWTRDVFLPRE